MFETFTCMHLADAFIQSDLQCIQAIHLYCQYVCSLGIEPTNFALLTQCSTTEPWEQCAVSWGWVNVDNEIGRETVLSCSVVLPSPILLLTIDLKASWVIQYFNSVVWVLVFSASSFTLMWSLSVTFILLWLHYIFIQIISQRISKSIYMSND